MIVPEGAERILQSPQARREAALFNSRYFAKRYLQLNQPEHTEPWHEFIDRGPERLICLAPRAHLKSTTYSYIAPIFKIYQKRDVRILLVSKTIDQAEKFLSAIKVEIESNLRLRHDFGDIKTGSKASGLPSQSDQGIEKWTTTQIYVKRPVVPGMPILKDPTILALGVGSGVTGGRADLILCDDILDDENTKTAGRRADIHNWFWGTLQQLLVPTGMLWVVGTRKHNDDLYGELLEKPGWVKRVDQAIIEAPARVWNIKWEDPFVKHSQDGITVELDNETKSQCKVLWESEWPIEKLIKDRLDTGAVIFDREKQNQPHPEAGMLPLEWLHLYNVKDTPNEGVIIYGIDLALSEQNVDKNDSFALAKVLVDRNRTIWLFDVFENQLRFLDQARAIIHHNKFHPAIKILIESQQYQVALPQYMEDMTSLPVEPIIQTRNKYDRWNAISAHFASGRVRVASHLTQFVTQWKQFPFGKHDDILDAVEIAVKGALSEYGAVPEAAQRSLGGYGYGTRERAL